MGKIDYYSFGFFKRFSNKLPYIKYLRDNYVIKYNNYSGINFWYSTTTTIKNFRLTRFIEYNNLNKCNKKINFISVFGSRKVLKYVDGVKIFYTGEYIGKDRFPEYDDYCLNDVDLSIGFREYNINNYIRFPLRISYLFNPDKTSIDDINDTIESLEKQKLNLLDRKKFCALISSHDDVENSRNKAFNIVSKYGKVDSPGKLLHNVDVAIPNYQDKLDFLGNYKYNICPENKEDVGYITEKLVDSWKAGCIPIYKGLFGELEKNIFNKDCIIWLNGLDNGSFSEETQKMFLNNQIFKKGSSEYIYTVIRDLQKAIKRIL